MKVAKENFSHIRKKAEFTGEVASITLDTYYKKNVEPHWGVHKKRISKWRKNFKRMHYFGPKYWVDSSPEHLEEVERWNILKCEIRVLYEQIEFHVLAYTQQKILNQLKNELAQLEVSKENKKGIQYPIEAPKPQNQQPSQPLMIMIDDQIIYDEKYKLDPLWMEDDDDMS